MQLNDYYNLIVSGEPGHWDRGEGKTLMSSFHYCSVDTVRKRFSPMSDAIEMSLKQFPAIFACETDRASLTPAYVGHITKVEHRSDGHYYLHFARDDRVEPIAQDRLLTMADALDIRAPARGLGDLNSSHWSVKHVDLYHVLERNGLVRPAAQAKAITTAAEVAPGKRHPLAEPLGTMWQPPGGVIRTAAQASAAARASAAPVAASIGSTRESRRVFIVHGHNVGVREEVARFVATLGLEPVILHEQANQGRTILTKFQEEAATAGFAIVLLTGDDRGGVANVEPEQYQPRARQNVVFEFGFFAGSLGLKHVCALVDGPVEKPSDIDGLVYVSRAGEWRIQLAREMKAAGLPIDASKLI